MRLKATQPTRTDNGAQGHPRRQLQPAARSLAPREPVGSLLHLQRSVGNRATTQMVQRLKINDCSTTDEGGISDALLQAHTDLSDAIQRILAPGGDHTFLHRVTSFFGTSPWGKVAEG